MSRKYGTHHIWVGDKSRISRKVDAVRTDGIRKNGGQKPLTEEEFVKRKRKRKIAKKNRKRK